jgi:hypothetical protein
MGMVMKRMMPPPEMVWMAAVKMERYKANLS